jgi:hypothetical protein
MTRKGRQNESDKRVIRGLKVKVNSLAYSILVSST